MNIGYSLMCVIRAKLRVSPKALVTKVVLETLWPAWLTTQSMVISLGIDERKMGDRGSKSDIKVNKYVC